MRFKFVGLNDQCLTPFLNCREYADLVSGQTILQDLVERQGIPVFNSIPIALNCTAKVNTSKIMSSIVLKLLLSVQILRENLSVQDLSLKDYAQPVKMAHVQLGDKLM